MLSLTLQMSAYVVALPGLYYSICIWIGLAVCACCGHSSNVTVCAYSPPPPAYSHLPIVAAYRRTGSFFCLQSFASLADGSRPVANGLWPVAIGLREGTRFRRWAGPCLFNVRLLLLKFRQATLLRHPRPCPSFKELDYCSVSLPPVPRHPPYSILLRLGLRSRSRSQYLVLLSICLWSICCCRGTACWLA